jgi:hypothetical protein
MNAPIDHLDASESETVRRHAATFRAVRAARLAASEEPSDERVHRSPRVPGREASSDEVPRPAATVAKLARAHGWAVRVTYAEGPSNESDRSVSSVAVRCELFSDTGHARFRYASAMWRCPGEKWVLAWCLTADRSDGLRKVTSRELKAYLAGVSDEKPGVATGSSDDVEYDATRTGKGGEEDT